MENKAVHIYNYDLIRILAILMVLFNHTRTFGYELCTVAVDPFSYWISLTEAVLCKCGVPLFMMVSGALLLDRHESVRDVMKKRVLPFAVIFCVMFFLQYLRLIRAGAYSSLSLKQYIGFLLGENPILPYWFLRTYLIYLVCLPFLRLIAQNMTEDIFHLFIAVEIAVSLMNLVGTATGIANTYTIPFHDSFVVYPVFGYWISRHKKTITRREICIFIVSILTAVLFTHIRNGMIGFQENSFAPFVWFFTVSIFKLVLSVSFQKEHPVLKMIGGSVFGIFLIEDIIRNRLEFMIPPLAMKITAIGAANVFIISVFITASLFVMIGKRIPGVRFFLK